MLVVAVVDQVLHQVLVKMLEIVEVVMVVKELRSLVMLVRYSLECLMIGKLQQDLLDVTAVAVAVDQNFVEL
jgi:hypothetical protein